MPHGSGSGPQALAEPEEAMFAKVAAQGHHADAAQKKVQQSVVRPPDVGFMALWAFNSHSGQSPENLGTGEVGHPRWLPPHSELQDVPLPTTADTARRVYQYNALNATNSQSERIISGSFQSFPGTHASAPEGRSCTEISQFMTRFELIHLLVVQARANGLDFRN
jgi:hypothetical protein